MSAKAKQSGGAKMGYISGRAGIRDTCCRRPLMTTLAQITRYGL
jgi:hypothetical protein